MVLFLQAPNSKKAKRKAFSSLYAAPKPASAAKGDVLKDLSSAENLSTGAAIQKGTRQEALGTKVC